MNQPGPAWRDDGGARSGRRAGRPRRRWRSALVALLALSGLVISGILLTRQLMPRTFTPAQRRQIQTWEVGRRWRILPKAAIFPARIAYPLSGGSVGGIGSVGLSGAPPVLDARRLAIARQATCARTGGLGRWPTRRLILLHGCTALLRATYADPTGGLVVTVGVAVLRGPAESVVAGHYLTGGRAGGTGAVALRPVLRPVPVAGSSAAGFGVRQRQLSWVVSAGPYLVVATVGYADGRPAQPVRSDAYTYLEITSLAYGVANAVARPLGAPAPVPRCPGAPAC